MEENKEIWFTHLAAQIYVMGDSSSSLQLHLSMWLLFEVVKRSGPFFQHLTLCETKGRLKLLWKWKWDTRVTQKVGDDILVFEAHLVNPTMLLLTYTGPSLCSLKNSCIDIKRRHFRGITFKRMNFVWFEYVKSKFRRMSFVWIG